MIRSWFEAKVGVCPNENTISSTHPPPSQNRELFVILKITEGHVIQQFDSETKQPLGQKFVSGGEVYWENGQGKIIDPDSECPYLPFDMVQPDMEDQ
jgi:hypothetical protein